MKMQACETCQETFGPLCLNCEVQWAESRNHFVTALAVDGLQASVAIEVFTVDGERRSMAARLRNPSTTHPWRSVNEVPAAQLEEAKAVLVYWVRSRGLHWELPQPGQSDSGTIAA